MGPADIANINENLYSYPAVAPPLHSFASHNPYAILDSGATGAFVTSSDAKHPRNVSPVIDGPQVLSASGTSMPVTLKGDLPLSPELSPAAQSALVLNELQTGALISLAQLCDDDCIAIFNKYLQFTLVSSP